MDSTHSQTMSKPLKINLLIPFISVLYKTFQFYNKLFSSSESVSKGPKHSLKYQTKWNFLKKFLKSYTSHGEPYDSTCTLICAKFFLVHLHTWIMHINFCKN
jgi:hypothetical protein